MDLAPAALVEAGARAYGVPALLAGCAMAMILWRGGPAARDHGETLGRVLVMAVLPETATIFGLLISIQIYGRTVYSGYSASLVEASGRAALYMTLGGLGAVVGAILIITGWDFRTPEKFSRALLRAIAAEPLMIIGLFLALTALGGGV